MNKFVVFILVAFLASMAYGSDIITVEFAQFHEQLDHLEWGFQWLDYTPSSGGGWYWVQEFVTVVIKRNGVVMETRSNFQIHENTTSDLGDIADDATALYADLERQEQLIANTIYSIDESINNPDNQDRAHTKLTETLIEQKREYERIEAAIDATMEDLRTEEGSGNLGWFEYN